MNGKLPNTPTEWVDPDDAPELTDEFFEKATPMIGERVVSWEEFAEAASEAIRRGRPRAESPKVSLTVRYDADVVKAFRATGKGWQTRMNAALKDWLKTHDLGGVSEAGQESRALAAVPGMVESVQEGLATPVEECNKKLDW